VKLSLFILGILMFFSLTIASEARATDGGQGQQFYMQYCSSCHGKDGRGNGSVTSYLKVKVPDLTLLKRNNNGVYPTARVMSSIDGTRAVRAHGEREMPVWGEVFRKETEGQRYSELTSLLKAKAIAEYVATLQR
jgi:mono/diheme cytochrome c family protein